MEKALSEFPGFSILFSNRGAVSLSEARSVTELIPLPDRTLNSLVRRQISQLISCSGFSFEFFF